jgi:hypothetical protein
MVKYSKPIDRSNQTTGASSIAFPVLIFISFSRYPFDCRFAVVIYKQRALTVFFLFHPI